ncbi:MAG: hypothetical protein KF866_03130 [Phycisphaeraceae bacterium]|nr:hypothetical protein [Phycisphaeraceae bacterium]MCW5753310.1 hypothetical protein [Phycisphaeraceae bacterium]
MDTVTTLRPGWRIKMIIIIVVLLGFGAWGFVDAKYVYPKRGLKVADKLELDYLRVSQPASGVLLSSVVSVPDPRSRLDELKSRGRTLSEREQRKRDWLDALLKAGYLTEDRTVYVDGDPDRDPSARFKALQDYWSTNPGEPKPLSRYDIFIQWLICVLSWLGGLLAIFMVVRVAGKKFRFHPETLTLTLPRVTPLDMGIQAILEGLRLLLSIVRLLTFNKLRPDITYQKIPAPGGQSITPDDLEEVDKSKWSRYFVHLRIKPGHATLGGKTVPIDLYRRGRLEDWILQMEAKAFPDAEPPPQEAEAVEQTEGDAPKSDAPPG